MTTILKGDSSAAITINFAVGFNYTGKTAVVAFLGVQRSFYPVSAGASVSLSFTPEETRMFPLGAFPLTVTLVGNDGSRTTIKNADVCICVTDDATAVNGSTNIIVDGGSQNALYQHRGEDQFVKSIFTGGVQHYKKIAIAFDVDMNDWGFDLTGDYTLVNGQFVNQEAPQ